MSVKRPSRNLSSIRRWLTRASLAGLLLFVGLFGAVYFGGAIGSDASADCIVVPGAAVWRNRAPSDALASRLQKALTLYRDGRAPLIVLTGGGEGNYDEPEVMKEWLTARGVPAQAILLDKAGANTRASGRNVARIMRAHGLRSVLVVSQWFHVARVRTCLEQEGVETFAAPADGNRLVREPYFVAREMVALPAFALRLDELRG